MGNPTWFSAEGGLALRDSWATCDANFDDVCGAFPRAAPERLVAARAETHERLRNVMADAWAAYEAHLRAAAAGYAREGLTFEAWHDIATVVSRKLLPLLVAAYQEDARTTLLPVVVLTSSKEGEDVAQSYELGASAYVRKPVDFAEFAAAAKMLALKPIAPESLRHQVREVLEGGSCAARPDVRPARSSTRRRLENPNLRRTAGRLRKGTIGSGLKLSIEAIHLSAQRGEDDVVALPRFARPTASAQTEGEDMDFANEIDTGRVERRESEEWR